MGGGVVAGDGVMQCGGGGAGWLMAGGEDDFAEEWVDQRGRLDAPGWGDQEGAVDIEDVGAEIHGVGVVRDWGIDSAADRRK